MDQQTQEISQRYVFDEKALTTQEACAFLNISRQTLYKLVKAKKIPGRKIGEKYRFFKSEILDMFKYESR